MMKFMKRLLRLGMTMLLLSAKEQDAKGAAARCCNLSPAARKRKGGKKLILGSSIISIWHKEKAALKT